LLKKLFFLTVVGMMLVPIPGPAEDAAAKGPQAFLPEPTHEFQPVVEGDRVVHEFILHNSGDDTLQIIKIASG
jgi:hypothetical protein